MKTYEQVNKDAREALWKWIDMVRGAAAGSLASITPPGNRYARGVRSEQRAKQGIKRLKNSIAKQFPLVTAYPAGKYDMHTNGYSPTHIYLLDKGKGIRKRETFMPVLGSAREVVAWWQANSKVMSKGKYRGKRRIKQGFIRGLGYSNPQAFVSKAVYLKQAAKEIQKRAGLFIAGWHTLFETLGKKIQPFTQSSALAMAKGKNLSKIHIDNSTDYLTAYIEANDSKPMEKYTQHLVDKDFPKTVAYYTDKMDKVLDKMLQKACGIDKTHAQEISKTIHIDL